MHQASVLDCLSFNPFSFEQDGVASAEVNIGRCQVADGLVVAPVVVVINEGADLGLEIARQVKQDQADLAEVNPEMAEARTMVNPNAAREEAKGQDEGESAGEGGE